MSMKASALILGWCLAFSPIHARDEGLPDATPEKLPRWRGFNLNDKKNLWENTPYKEADFQIIRDLGFNFARLPLDYRIWIVDGDWSKFNEGALREIDQAVEWGKKYQVHINLNFHRAPGYTVSISQPPEFASLWKDDKAQEMFCRHWALFAKRYKGIPNSQLSFNPINEPRQAVPVEAYVAVMKKVVEAIRKEDPDRLIIADGAKSASAPCAELVPLRVAQATRGYTPLWITHYKSSWLSQEWATDQEPIPTWPMLRVNPFLESSSGHSGGRSLVMRGDFPEGTRVRVKVECDPDGSWPVIKNASGSILAEQEGAKGLIVLEGVLAASSPRLMVENGKGGKAILKELTVQAGPQGKEYALPLMPAMKNLRDASSSVQFQPDHPDGVWGGDAVYGREWLRKMNIAPWRALEEKGVGVMVGEWGCFNTVPYDVTLRWMEDNLANFKEAGFGWALWNLSGPYGILNSNRPGAVYEDYKGEKLDRRMLELLQKY